MEGRRLKGKGKGKGIKEEGKGKKELLRNALECVSAGFDPDLRAKSTLPSVLRHLGALLAKKTYLRL